MLVVQPCCGRAVPVPGRHNRAEADQTAEASAMGVAVRLGPCRADRHQRQTTNRWCFANGGKTGQTATTAFYAFSIRVNAY